MRTTTFVASLATIIWATPTHAQLPTYGLSTRVELHMLPAVTSTPIDPTWHPDGQQLAYSMKGAIWIQTIGSDQARPTTQGPASHSDPTSLLTLVQGKSGDSVGRRHRKTNK